MGILSGLANFGLDGFKSQDIFVDERETHKKIVEEHTVAAPLAEKDYLFEKSYVCPVCDNKFKTLAVRTGKAKMLGQDEDLRPRYEGVDPLKYDAILCNRCGFAAISRGFTNMTSHQIKGIKEQVSANFKPLPQASDTYSYDDAIVRHKIALICAVVKNAKLSERAYICLKMSWLIKSKMESVTSDSDEYKGLQEDAKECVKDAYEGFSQAFSREAFPMCGMDEMTVAYLLAELARELGKYDEALKMAGRIISSKSANPRIKDKTLDLKERIKQDMARDAMKEGTNPQK
ncbi:MAG: DUF2225 domain-containing protein [Lachnospiraceae bacterium]|nr:DUF2225 domain-containing protein [Lachnospiraceae bacterium]